MKINWRVLGGGFLIEVVLAIVLIGGFAVAGVDLAKGVSTVSAVVIGVGCFAGDVPQCERDAIAGCPRRRDRV